MRRRVVNHVHRAFKSTSTIFWLTNNEKMMIDPVWMDIQNQFFLPYKSYYFKQNPFDPVNLSSLKKTSVSMEQLIPVSDFHRTEYYNDFIKPQNIHRQMAVYIKQNGRLKGVLGMHRSFKKSFDKKFLFMGDIIAGQLTAAFERLSLKEEIDKTKDLFKMMHGNKSIGIILLDATRKYIFSNIRAEQVCSRLLKKFAPFESSASSKCLVPDIISDDCRLNPGMPFLFKERVLSVSLCESYRVKCHFLDKETSGSTMDFFVVTLEDECNCLDINAVFLEDKYNLTKREIEIVSYIHKGYTNLEIANDLFISEGTVKNHLKNIFAKTSARNRTHLIHKIMMGI